MYLSLFKADKNIPNYWTSDAETLKMMNRHFLFLLKVQINDIIISTKIYSSYIGALHN